MGWPLSVLLGALNALAAGFATGLAASLWADWYHVTSFEGASGYFVVALALLGMVGGFVIGLVWARAVAATPAPGFLRALGFALLTTAGILALITGLAWLNADFPPQIDGKELVVDVEVRFPASLPVPTPSEAAGYGWHITLTADGGSRPQRVGGLRVREATQIEGRWVVPATVFLHTSDPGKSLGVGLGNRESQFFRPSLPGRPARENMAWSSWLTEPTFGNLKPVPTADAVAIRYRVQFFVEPPAPPPTPPVPTEAERAAKAEAEARAAFAALTPQSPLEEWLRFTHYAQPQERRLAAGHALALRADVVPALSAIIRSPDKDQSDLALRAVAVMEPPPEGLGVAVAEVGHDIADQIRTVNNTSAEADPSYTLAGEVSVRFAGWSEAARVLHGRPGVDLRPVMEEILSLARVRTESLSMKDVARVSGYYANLWSGKPTTPAR
jgi:hypothetical protein